MDEELNLDLDTIENNVENKLKVKNRFEQLSEKVILTSKEKDEALAKVTSAAQAQANAEKERDFYKDFSANVTKYPNASEYQAQILEKVKGGYSTEDAMVSVLAKEGKLSQAIQQPVAPIVDVAGGSAPTIITGDKPLNEMTSSDKFSALQEIEEKTGDLSKLLRGGR